MNNSPLGLRLITLWQLLQQPTTTFGEVLALSAECSIDGRQVLADHFAASSKIIVYFEA